MAIANVMIITGPELSIVVIWPVDNMAVESYPYWCYHLEVLIAINCVLNWIYIA